MTKPIILCILDGWGEQPAHDTNAITLAHTPIMDSFKANFPHAYIETSGESVGLPSGQMGNSEVGHMNIGAGRIIMQDLPRIDQAINDGSLAQHYLLLKLIQHLKTTRGTCHLLGLLSPGGVHALDKHMLSLSRLIAKEGVPVTIHAFLDGRDTPPKSARDTLEHFLKEISSIPLISIATFSGRYFAMDRDKRWDRVSKAYNAIALGDAPHASDPLITIEQYYNNGITDEFIPPTCLNQYRGIQKPDAMIMVNFRADRAREILEALVLPDFNAFPTPVKSSLTIGMTEYSSTLNPYVAALFPSIEVPESFGVIISDLGLTQLRIAETEKYAHVTFFFNGGTETAYPGETRKLIPSPNVATYDLKPEMSAIEITDFIVQSLNEDRFDVIIVNFANTDMVGHTGDLKAAIKAVETVDICLGNIYKALEAKQGIMLITADHGNAEQMEDHETHQPHTAHTTNVVPLLLVGAIPKSKSLKDGRLCDIAPTLLELMHITKPAAMTGTSLLTDTTSTKGNL